MTKGIIIPTSAHYSNVDGRGSTWSFIHDEFDFLRPMSAEEQVIAIKAELAFTYSNSHRRMYNWLFLEEMLLAAEAAVKEGGILEAQARQAEAARLAAIAEAARIEAAAQAEAIRLLEQSARLNAEAALVERGVLAAKQDVTQLEAQLVIAQAATAEAIELTGSCAAQREAAERTLETVNERVEQTFAQYTAFVEEARKNADLYAKMLPNVVLPRQAAELEAADKRSRESERVQRRAGIVVEHVQLQKTTELALQNAIDTLTLLNQQQVSLRTTVQEKTQLALERARQVLAHLMVQQLVAQNAVATASNQLKAVLHRLSTQQQTEAKRQAELTTQASVKQSVSLAASVDEAVSRQLAELTTQLTAIQEKIESMHQASKAIIAMEREAQQAAIKPHRLMSYPYNPYFQTVYEKTLEALIKEYHLTQELALLEQAGDPVAAIVEADLAQIAQDKTAFQQAESALQPGNYNVPSPFALQKYPAAEAVAHTLSTYQANLAYAYQAFLQRKIQKQMQQAECDVVQLTTQHAEALQVIQHLSDTGAAPSEMTVAMQTMTELSARLSAAQDKVQAILIEKTRLTEQEKKSEDFAESYAIKAAHNYASNMFHGRSNTAIATVNRTLVLSRVNVLSNERYVSGLDGFNYYRTLHTPFFKTEASQSVLPKTKRVDVKGNPAQPLPSGLKSLELIFKYGLYVLTSDDDIALHLEDKSLNLATQLFILDLAFILIYHAPTIQKGVLSMGMVSQSLFYLQNFLTNNPEGYNQARLRMSKRFSADPVTIMGAGSRTTETLDIPLSVHKWYSAFHVVQLALLALQVKVLADQKKYRRSQRFFFSATAEIRESSDFFHPQNDVKEHTEFTQWVLGLEARAMHLNLLDLPDAIVEKIRTRSANSHTTEIVQSTLS